MLGQHGESAVDFSVIFCYTHSMNNDAKILTKRRKAKYRAILNRYGPVSMATKMDFNMIFFELYKKHRRQREEESDV